MLSGRPFLYFSLPSVAFILGVFWYRRRNNRRLENGDEGGGGSGGDELNAGQKQLTVAAAAAAADNKCQKDNIKQNGNIITAATKINASKSMNIKNGNISNHKHGQQDIEIDNDDNNSAAIRQFGKSAPINIIPNGNGNGNCNGIIAALQQNVVDSEVLKSKIQDVEHKILRSIDEDFENLSSPVDLPDSMHNNRLSFYTATRNVNIKHDEPPVVIKATTTPKISPENSFLERNFVKSPEQNNNNCDDLPILTKTISATTRALSQSPQDNNNNKNFITSNNSTCSNSGNRRLSATATISEALPVIQETKNEAQQLSLPTNEVLVAEAEAEVKSAVAVEVEDEEILVGDIVAAGSTAIETTTTTTTTTKVTDVDKRKDDTASPSLSLCSEQSTDSGKGSSLPRSEAIRAKPTYEFLFPVRLICHLYGRKRKFYNHLQAKSGANVTLSREIFNELLQNNVRICVIEGTESEIMTALSMIRERLPLRRYPNFTMERIHYAQPQSVVPLSTGSHNLQLNLIEGINNDIIVSTILSASHIFVQQPLHPTHPSLMLLQKGLYDRYTNTETPMLPGIEINAVCVTCVNRVWYRVQIVETLPEDENRCLVRFLDYGGYLNVHFNDLRQIRTDFMSMPFQATECILSNIEPIGDTWSQDALDILCNLTKGIVLQAQVAGYNSHNIPEILLFACVGPNVSMSYNKKFEDENE